MGLVAMAEVLHDAATCGTGLGAFNVIQIEHAEAIVAGAEIARRPVVLQVSENTAAYHAGLAPIVLACLAIARESSASVVVHLDHATRRELVEVAVELGVGSVMFDASALDYADNVIATAEVGAWCRARSVSVEAELGEIGGKDGVHSPGARTDPVEAREYVEATGVGALAVAVGTSHAMVARDAELDYDLIRRLRSAVPVPLVLHGSSGVSDTGLAAAVEAGITKVNIATQLNKVMTAAVRGTLAADEALIDPRKYLGPARDAVAAEVARLLGLLSG